jgi:hypothetical protein
MAVGCRQMAAIVLPAEVECRLGIA